MKRLELFIVSGFSEVKDLPTKKLGFSHPQFLDSLQMIVQLSAGLVVN